MTMEQFIKAMDHIDRSMISSQADGEDENELEPTDSDDGALLAEEEEALRENEQKSDEEMARELFDLLKPKDSEMLPLRTFTSWSQLRDAIKSGELTVERLQELIEDVVKPEDNKQLSFEKFFRLLSAVESEVVKNQETQNEMIKRTAIAKERGSSKSLTAKEELDFAIKDAEGDLQEMEQDMQIDVRNIFEELSRGRKFITDSAVKKWADLKEMVDSGCLQQEVVEKILQQVRRSDGTLDFPAFEKFMSLLDKEMVGDCTPSELKQAEGSEMT